jgi:predicted MFS family arabinose efflux permease
MSHSAKKPLWSLAPLFLVLLIDSMGLGLLFPVLNALIIDPASGFVLQHTTAWRSAMYGFTIGIFMLSWFFGSAILGDLSDVVGRKKALMICLVGAFGGYLLSALAIPMKSLGLLIVGRIIAGFTAGSQPIAQAAIIDVSSEEHKARNISLILLAISVGFVLGPICGGILTDSKLFSWFNFDTPMYFAAIIALFNAIILWFSFSETFKRVKTVKIDIMHAIHIFLSAFRHKAIWFLSLVFFIMIIGWSNYFSYISMFVYHRYGYDASMCSWFLADMALGFAIGCYSVDRVTQWLGLKWAVVFGYLLTGVFAAAIVLTHNIVLTWVLNCLIGAVVANSYSSILTLFSNAVSGDEQGWVMGVSGSVMALAFAITNFVVAPLIKYGFNFPLVLCAIGMVVSGLLMIAYKKEA